jgi:hypothetical protein
MPTPPFANAHDPTELQSWLQLLRVLLAIVRRLPTLIRSLTELVRVWRAPKGNRA